MENPSPYQPPPNQGPPSLPIAQLPEPAAPKVFGIMHLVLAAYGIVMGSWGLVTVFYGNPFLKLFQDNPAMEAQMDAQLALQEKIKAVPLTSGLLALLVAIPMIIAGIKLLQKRKSGLKWSNIYAYSSLSAKVVNLFVGLTVMVPAMRDITQTVAGTTPGGSSYSGIMSGFMSGGMVITTLLTCIYPILSLVLLNNAQVKQWFAARPN